jgi:hypothetical protein
VRLGNVERLDETGVAFCLPYKAICFPAVLGKFTRLTLGVYWAEGSTTLLFRDWLQFYYLQWLWIILGLLIDVLDHWERSFLKLKNYSNYGGNQ